MQSELKISESKECIITFLYLLLDTISSLIVHHYDDSIFLDYIEIFSHNYKIEFINSQYHFSIL